MGASSETPLVATKTDCQKVNDNRIVYTYGIINIHREIGADLVKRMGTVLLSPINGCRMQSNILIVRRLMEVEKRLFVEANAEEGDDRVSFRSAIWVCLTFYPAQDERWRCVQCHHAYDRSTIELSLVEAVQRRRWVKRLTVTGDTTRVSARGAASCFPLYDETRRKLVLGRVFLVDLSTHTRLSTPPKNKRLPFASVVFCAAFGISCKT